MRRLATVRTVARIRLWARRSLPWPTRWVLVVLAAGLAWWLMAVRGQLTDGAVLGLLAAGGWGLGLIPVHADRNATGPLRRRRRREEAVGRVEAQPPPIG
ncbi:MULTISPECIES: hypothetical protein [Kitasatospora]|uniref:DUF3040 domain-containing protein n=1 Tax=Kitasatospora cathayae TaxID=3004092 RepID=A0ABY7Q244_9ACTN|nr:hypothetical protein [Kitasatospora sp. HUAS 3-15]WBP86775.1 hypothetical protein O1G21_13620 [Kitasatospora sp. HUAS 3-15]